MAPIRLSILEYLRYLEGHENSRRVYEGEEVLNAGHVILCGITSQNEAYINIFALCLQTSAINSDPHEVKGVLDTNRSENVRVQTMLCSCKAGNGGRCKHISAVLLYCTRENLNDMELVSQTDIKCMWAAQKHRTTETYKAVAIPEMPCFKNSAAGTHIVVDEVKLAEAYIKRLPMSSLAKHSMGRRQCTDSNIDDLKDGKSSGQNLYSNILLNHACQSILMLELSAIEFTSMEECCNDSFKTLFNDSDAEVCINAPQNSRVWHTERRHRVTGSRCYGLYTYARGDWEKVALKHFWPKNIKNKFVRHGVQYEAMAREAFIQMTNLNVKEFGLVISQSSPWLGYSPDGVIFEGDKPVALLEIKCLFAGSETTIQEALKSAKYITNNNGTYQLKRKHKYYGQINMGMSLLNLNLCYFVVYASYDDSIEIIKINYDYEFSKIMLMKVKHNFFENMFYILCRYK